MWSQAVPARAEKPLQHFAISSGRATQTLKQFAAQAGCEIVFSPEVSGEIRTRAVRGEYSAKAALSQMLEGTGLIANQDSTGAFAVRRSPSALPVNAPHASATRATSKPASETIELSPFTISSETVGRYAATESTSGTRVRESLMDSPQSITVITRELVEDVGATRILDAAKYAANISESTIPNAQDRTNIRGFQTDGATIDGFNFFSFSNVDPALIDRLEIVKGPNAILSPQIAQGTVNVVSKRPLFTDESTVDLEVGRYDADGAELDVNRVLIDNRLAMRVVGAVREASDQAPGNFNHSQVAMPMMTYRISDKAQITAQAQLYNTYNAAYGGIPVDFSVGTNDPAVFLKTIPEDLDLYGTAVRRHSTGQHYRIFFEAAPTDRFSIRLALNHIHWAGDSIGLSINTSPIDPTTGQHVPEAGAGGMLQQNPNTGAWNSTGRYIEHPIFDESSNTTAYAAGAWAFQTRSYYNLQNDYSYRFDFGENKSTTLAGYMMDYLKNPNWSYNVGLPNIDITHFVRQPVTVSPTLNLGWGYGISWDQQVYLSEQLSLLKDHLILSGGYTHADYRQYASDLSRRTTALNKVHANLPNAAIVLKPIAEIALFADTTRQSQPNGTSPSTGANPTTTGKQYEFGIRTELLDRRLYSTFTYFNISQNNFSIPNEGNITNPPPDPLLPPIFTDRKVTGVEWELTAAINDQLSVIGNFAYTRARTPLGQAFRGVAERTGGALLNYRFNKAGPLKGLSVGIGLDYVAKRPGDNPSPAGYVASSGTDQLVVGQPTFYLPARTLINVMVAYRFAEHWKIQLNIDNITNVDYMAASTARNTVFPGTPINPRLTLGYSF